MIKLHILIFLVLLLFHTSYSLAQIRINRSWQVSPFEHEIGNENRFFGQLLFAAEANHGWFSEEEALTWTIRYHGFVELYRWGDRSMLGLYLGHELHANPFNEIYFNPRAAFWNESIVFYHRLNALTLQAGIEHRCRHDVDNLDAPSPAALADYEGLGRIIVLNSVLLGIQTRIIDLADRLKFSASGIFYYYLYTEDSREPEINQQGSWEEMSGSASLRYQFNYSLTQVFQMYQRSNLDYVFIKNVERSMNARLELGLSVKGKKGLLSIFSGYEYFFDDVSRPMPRPSSMIFLGIRGGSHAFQ